MNVSELMAGHEIFQAHEPRDAMYETASFLVEHFWGKSREISNSLGVLLLTWNQAFYRYGPLNFGALEKCIVDTQERLNEFRRRDILSYTSSDDQQITALYDKFLVALQISEGEVTGRRSPVAVAKALHLLAPAFFPLWDAEIAANYGCKYQYIPFIRKMKTLAEELAPKVNTQETGKTLLKLIDEYNYSRFTKKWI